MIIDDKAEHSLVLRWSKEFLHGISFSSVLIPINLNTHRWIPCLNEWIDWYLLFFSFRSVTMASSIFSPGRFRRDVDFEDDSAPSPMQIKRHPRSQSSSDHSITSSDPDQLDHSADTLDEQSPSVSLAIDLTGKYFVLKAFQDLFRYLCPSNRFFNEYLSMADANLRCVCVSTKWFRALVLSFCSFFAIELKNFFFDSLALSDINSIWSDCQRDGGTPTAEQIIASVHLIDFSWTKEA